MSAITGLRCAGAALVAALVVVQLRCMGPAVWGLNAALIAAYALWSARLRSPPPAGVLPLYALALVLQAAHFAEEYSTGFQEQFPSAFGYVWTDAQFAEFNLLWLAGFALSCFGIARGRRLPLLIAWFFALAGGIGNGVAHVVLALLRGGYFPGLVTAPLLFIAGVVLLRRLSAS